ncbi:MAG: DNA primase [Anaerolineaceae bacterium]|nr:DNA primase [Anaerolineaceae bacterium]
MSVVDEVKNRLDILEIVSESVKLKRSGKSYSGFCPFHKNTRTPAFVVFPDSGTWRCFGQCNEGGDVFKFVMKKEGWDFAETLKYLANRAGIELKPLTPQQQEEEASREQSADVLEEAVKFFQHQLLHHPAGKSVLAYLKKRGVQADTIQSFGLGYALDEWSSLLDAFTAKGMKIESLDEAGLLSQRSDQSGYYDRFRNRLVFPIRDANGRMCGFGARTLDPEGMPKYLNSPQTTLFDKSRLLYGLDKARKSIRSEDYVVVVEGYMDVIVPQQAGFLNVVSPMGTALTEYHLRTLKRYTRKIILALDPDAAGQKAILKGLQTARDALDHDMEIAFNPRGLVMQEGRLQADLRVCTLPDGMDPDEIVIKDPALWADVVKEAKPIITHVMDTLMEGQNLEDPKAIRDIADQMLPLIDDVANQVERDAYRQLLARRLKIDERTFMQSRPIRKSSRGTRRKSTIDQQTINEIGQTVIEVITQPTFKMERHCLSLLLRKPESTYSIDRALQKANLQRISYYDFEVTEFQTISRVLFESLAQDQMDAEDYFYQHLPEPLRANVDELLQPMSLGEPLEDKMILDMYRTLLNIREIRAKLNNEKLAEMQKEMEEQGEESFESIQEMHVKNSLLLGRIERATQQLRRTIKLD